MTTSESKWYVNVSSVLLQIMEYMVQGRITWNWCLLVKPLPEHSLIDNQIIGDLQDRIYRYRYIIPSDVGIQSARPPRDGYVLQTSNDVTGVK